MNDDVDSMSSGVSEDDIEAANAPMIGVAPQAAGCERQKLLMQTLRGLIGSILSCDVSVLHVQTLLAGRPASAINDFSIRELYAALCAIEHEDDGSCARVSLQPDPSLRRGVRRLLSGVNWPAMTISVLRCCVAHEIGISDSECIGMRSVLDVAIMDEMCELDRSGASRFLFDSALVDSDTCVARVWCSLSQRPIFRQCCKPVSGTYRYCIVHARKALASGGTWRMGDWDPGAMHASVPATEMRKAWHYAPQRAVAASLPGPALRSPVVRSCREQRPYISIPVPDRGLPRPVCRISCRHCA